MKALAMLQMLLVSKSGSEKVHQYFLPD